MNGKDLMLGLNYISRRYIDEAEYDTLPGQGKSSSGKYEREAGKTIRFRKILLIAAVIALMALLVGCGIVYALRLQNLKIGEKAIPMTQYDEVGNPVGETEVALDVLSLQGIKDSPNYLANQEWLAFTESYVFPGGEYWESDEDYWAYNVLNQEMVDKLDEICAKYGLKIIGKPWHEHLDCGEMLKLAGVDSLLKADSEGTVQLPQGRFFPGGSFNVYGTLTMPGVEQPISLSYACIQKDVFYDVFAYLDSDAVTQRGFTTGEGVPLLLLESEQSGMILADRESCFINLSVVGYSGASLEEIAEQFDFTIQPHSLDAAAADAREQASIAQWEDNSGMDPNFLQRATYQEYVEDLLWNDSLVQHDPTENIPEREYVFYDLDGNGVQELLIFYNGYIGSVVGMKDGKTDEGKSYHLKLYEGNVLIENGELETGPLAGTNYHIFTFANNDDPVFSNPKERSIVRLRKDLQGQWWRTSSTDHYAEFDTQIMEDEALEILNAYKPVELDTRPLTEFEEP